MHCAAAVQQLPPCLQGPAARSLLAGHRPLRNAPPPPLLPRPCRRPHAPPPTPSSPPPHRPA
jgi:hypothetical protein